MDIFYKKLIYYYQNNNNITLMNKYKFLIQKLNDISPFHLNELVNFRKEHYGNYINNKNIIDKCIKQEFVNVNQIYINSYMNKQMIGTLKITRLDSDIGISGFYIQKDFRNKTINQIKIKYIFFLKAFDAIENTYKCTPNLIKIDIAKNSPKKITDMYVSLGFKYTNTFYNF